VLSTTVLQEAPTVVLIMAKAPRAGAAKTRLHPLLGPQGCARLLSAEIAAQLARS